LSVIQKPEQSKGKHYGQWLNENAGKETWQSVIKSGVDECIEKAATKRDFFTNLAALGYEYKIGKDISVRPPGKERFFRLVRHFGADYTIEQIELRISKGSNRRQILPVPTKRSKSFAPPKKLPFFARGSIVALHRHYLYLMGYYERHGNPSTNARTHFLLRDDIRKLDDYIADTKLMERVGIDDKATLLAYRASCENEIATLLIERKELKNEIRCKAGRGNPYTTKDNPRYLQINTQLRNLRGEVMQLERIYERSHTLANRIERIERDEDKKLTPQGRKEKQNGRSRTSDRYHDANSAHGR
jgi:hypothetical protein